MSHDERVAFINLIDELFSGKLGKFIGWLKWLVVAVIAGTIAVVGFVFEVRTGVKDAQSALERHTRQIDALEDKQETTNNMVQRHEALISHRSN